MIAVIDYNAGNVQSVRFALQRLGVEGILTRDHQQILQAEKVIFPGVGEAAQTMRYLQTQGLDRIIKQLTQPVLGICLGMQLLCEHSEEGDTDCLGIVPAQVKKFRTEDRSVKIPHMGWNVIQKVQPQSFLPDSVSGQYAYFVHSYFVEIGPFTSATTDYIHPFSSVIEWKNFFATQFHPEKSGKVGEEIIQAFLEL